MNINITEYNGHTIATVSSEKTLIKDVSSALDLMASVQYETGSGRIAIDKATIIEDFFELRTKLAGEILQKFINYNVKFAVYGDFTGYTSKALRDFIYESNNGNHIFFVDTLEAAIEKLGKAG